MTWIETIEPDAAEGELARIYDAVSNARSGVAAIHLAQSLNPRAIKAHLELYKCVMFARSSLERALRERIAVVVSAANDCRYCVEHHTEAARQAGAGADLLEALKRLEIPETEPPAERALLEWARKATVSPSSCDEGDVATLKEAGLDDRAILDASLVVAYFNFVNRLVLTLGVDLEGDFERYCGADPTED